MNAQNEKIELFRALEVTEVEERAQNVIIDIYSSSSSNYYGVS